MFCQLLGVVLSVALLVQDAGKKRKSTAKAPAACKKRSLTKDKAPVATRKKYRQWTEESMLGALKAVKEGTWGLMELPRNSASPKQL